MLCDDVPVLDSVIMDRICTDTSLSFEDLVNMSVAHRQFREGSRKRLFECAIFTDSDLIGGERLAFLHRNPHLLQYICCIHMSSVQHAAPTHVRALLSSVSGASSTKIVLEACYLPLLYHVEVAPLLSLFHSVRLRECIGTSTDVLLILLLSVECASFDVMQTSFTCIPSHQSVTFPSTHKSITHFGMQQGHNDSNTCFLTRPAVLRYLPPLLADLTHLSLVVRSSWIPYVNHLIKDCGATLVEVEILTSKSH